MTTSSTLTSCAACLALLAPRPGAGRYAVPAPTSASLLRRVLQAEDHIAFRARQSLVVPIEARAQSTVTDEEHDGRGRSRIVYRQPPPAAGRTVVSDGRWVWEYDPVEGLAVRHPVPAPVHGGLDTLRRIVRAYALTVDRRPARWGGRRAWVLRIASARADRPRYVWWVDALTALVLKRETFDAQGVLREVASYSSLELGGTGRRESMSFVPPPGTHVVHRSAGQIRSTLAEARRLAPRWAQPPVASLGDGFDFASAQIVTVKGKPSLQTQYSDGLATVSVIQIPASASLPLEGRVSRVVQLGSTSATLMQMAPFRVLSWRSAGTTYSIVADLGEVTLLRIARRLL